MSLFKWLGSCASVLGVLLFLSSAPADTHLFPSENFENSWLKIFPAGSFESKPSGRSPLQYVFGNTPQGKVQRAVPEECSSFQLEKEMTTSSRLGVQQQAKVLQNFFSRCEKPLTPFYSGKYPSLLRLAEGNYPLGGRPYLKELVFTLPYNITVHGLLALKDSIRPRPLVIFNCGTGCNLSDAMARLFLAEIFDQTPFNVLILPSLASNDFIKDNREFGLGGFEEGRLTFEVIRLLGGQDSPFLHLISSFHILGVSLGGNGSLFAGVYGTYNNSVLPGPKIQSVTSYCPVIDLKAAFSDLDRNDLTGRYFTGVVKDTIIKNFALVFGSNHDLPELYTPGHHQTIPFIEKYILPTYQSLSKLPHFNIPPFTEYDFSTGDAFWKANNYLNYYSAVTVPTLIVYSKDDFIVSPKDNSQKLEQELVTSPNPNINVIHLNKGSHCAAMEVYGEDLIVNTVQSFILGQSPEFDFASGKRTLNLAGLTGSQQVKLLYTGEKFFGYKWNAKKGATEALLNIEVWTPYKEVSDNYRCTLKNPYYAFEGCFRQVEVKVPLKYFFPDLNTAITNGAQAQALTRWLNVRARVLTSGGFESIDSLESPDHIEWTID